MNRRQFLGTSLAAGAATTWPALGAAPTQEKQVSPASAGTQFKLKFAPHPGQFKQHAGDDVLDQLRFIADEGFRAFEDNGMMGRPSEQQEQIGRTLERLGLTMGAFVAYAEFGEPTLVRDDPAVRAKLLEGVRDAVQTAKRVQGRWAIVVPGCADPRLGWDYQTAQLVDHLKAAAEICEPAKLTLIVEPLNPRDHPRLFVTRIGQAFQICRAVGSPACKILNDLYHQQITEGDLIPNIDRAWSEIAYFHLGDTPGRKEPGTGEVNFRNIFRHLHAKGYDGVLGMEHGQSQSGRDGERAVIDAYRACSAF